MNPFTEGKRKLIPAVLIYVRCRDRVLMIHRNSRPEDYHAGKWNGLGGKLEADESPIQAARRELREESGLDLPEAAFRVLGVVQFPDFKAYLSEDWLAFVLVAEVPGDFLDKPLIPGGEGELHWVSLEGLPQLNLWAGDRHFLDFVIQGKPFVGTIWYRGQEVKQAWVQPL